MSERRFLVLGSLLLLVVIFGIGISSDSAKMTPEGSLSHSLETKSAKTAVEEAAASKAKNIESYVQGVIQQMPATVSFALVDLNNAETVRINNTNKYISASLYKLFVAYYTYDQIDQERVSYNTLVEGRTIAVCLDRIITVSDNDCGVALGDYFGWTNITNFVQASGFNETVIVRAKDSDDEFMTSPSDIETFFIRLYRGQLLSQSSTTAFLDTLKKQEINDRLPAIVPSGITVAHKTGDVYDVIHDAGIIYSPGGDYVFVIMSSGWEPSLTFGEAYEYFKIIYDSIFNNILAY